ncbi:hypothetical protein H6G96_33880 [Nostoc sp. FACHB-892]|uniref:hypothetical protein n=1 Tax=Nostoc sp. FACHB-892 TaxID=2692843 RepID=UPI001685868E|nr:hypothetical protein [Nostoc sp. FACHB-892]MBD2731175.1 hypothetical protein [Nostoc sp. FACHB-892]
MNSKKPSIKHTCIDGQEILFPSQMDWETLKLNPIIDDRPLAILDSIWSALEFAQKYPEIHLGLGKISSGKKWMPYIFLDIESNFQRVHLETLTCSFCNWRGKTANPMVIDPYFGDGINQDHFTLMRAAERYPVLPCPSCGNRLPRHPIWVEPVNYKD